MEIFESFYEIREGDSLTNAQWPRAFTYDLDLSSVVGFVKR